MSQPILLSLIKDLPMIVVALAAVVTACVLWQRAPLSSLLLVLASIWSLFLLIAYPFAYETVVHLTAPSPQSIARLNFAFGLGWSFFRAGFLVLLVMAVYAGRPAAQPSRLSQ
ncbi:MAG: hypothetical protein WCK27_28380 [Verrucomicrobiota bacterium]